MTRTPAEAIAAVQRHGPAITEEQRRAALALLTDMYAAAARHGFSADDFAWVCDLPGAAVDLVLRKRRRTTDTTKED